MYFCPCSCDDPTDPDTEENELFSLPRNLSYVQESYLDRYSVSANFVHNPKIERCIQHQQGQEWRANVEDETVGLLSAITAQELHGRCDGGFDSVTSSGFVFAHPDTAAGSVFSHTDITTGSVFSKANSDPSNTWSATHSSSFSASSLLHPASLVASKISAFLHSPPNESMDSARDVGTSVDGDNPLLPLQTDNFAKMDPSTVEGPDSSGEVIERVDSAQFYSLNYSTDCCDVQDRHDLDAAVTSYVTDISAADTSVVGTTECSVVHKPLVIASTDNSAADNSAAVTTEGSAVHKPLVIATDKSEAVTSDISVISLTAVASKDYNEVATTGTTVTHNPIDFASVDYSEVETAEDTAAHSQGVLESNTYCPQVDVVGQKDPGEVRVCTCINTSSQELTREELGEGQKTGYHEADGNVGGEGGHRISDITDDISPGRSSNYPEMRSVDVDIYKIVPRKDISLNIVKEDTGRVIPGPTSSTFYGSPDSDAFIEEGVFVNIDDLDSTNEKSTTVSDASDDTCVSVDSMFLSPEEGELEEEGDQEPPRKMTLEEAINRAATDLTKMSLEMYGTSLASAVQSNTTSASSLLDAEDDAAVSTLTWRTSGRSSPVRGTNTLKIKLSHHADTDTEHYMRESPATLSESPIYMEQEFNFSRVQLRKSSSLKSNKTPPGTPHRKKVVRFADAMGLDLESVRHVLNMESPPRIPPSALADLVKGLDDDVKDIGSRYLCPCFNQPGAADNFFMKVRSQKVSLENAIINDLTITGFVRVANISYHKSVRIRYTHNAWSSFYDIAASYVLNSCDGPTDRFSFSIVAPPFFGPGSRLEFAVCLIADGVEYWDNNNGQNYVFECFAKSIPTDSETAWLHFL